MSVYNFPSLPQNIDDVDFKTLFHWGCNQLVPEQQQCPTQGIFKIVRTKTIYNIIMAIKYGIWSFPILGYCFNYFKNSIKPKNNKKSDMYYVFICKNHIIGIAKVISFDSQKSFKFWDNNQQMESKDPKSNIFLNYFGIINIKFLKIGRFKIDFIPQKVHFQAKQIVKYWSNLHLSALNLKQFRNCQILENKKRQLFLSYQKEVEFQNQHKQIQNLFYFHVNRLKQQYIIKCGRQNFYKQKKSISNIKQNYSSKTHQN